MARQIYSPAAVEAWGRACSRGCRGSLGGQKSLSTYWTWPFLRCERGCYFCAATMLVLGVVWKLLILYKATQ